MTDDAKLLVEELRHNAEWCKKRERDPYLAMSEYMALAADLIEWLYANLESDERQYCRDAFATLVNEGVKIEADRDAWKQRCEAAERDMACMVPCISCKRYKTSSPACDACEADAENGWRKSNYTWRGPCEENGGDMSATD